MAYISQLIQGTIQEVPATLESWLNSGEITAVVSADPTNGSGTGYAVGNTLTIFGGGRDATVTVASVDAMTGGVKTVTLVGGGTNYNSSITYGVTGGAGTGCQLTVNTVTAQTITTMYLTQDVQGGNMNVLVDFV